MDVRAVIRSVFDEVVADLGPEALTHRAVAELAPTGRVHVVAIGKAAAGMTRGAAAGLGGTEFGGLIVSDRAASVPNGFRLLVGSHPSPDERSVLAGTAALEYVSALDAADTLLVLVSGGGSALTEVPAGDLAIADLSGLAADLMDAGTPIGELNTVRRHLSRFKNGGLLAATGAGRVITLVISDVIGGPASTVASGPTLADDTTPDDARTVLRDRLGRVPDHIEAALAAPRNRPLHAAHDWEVLADCRTAASVAVERLRHSGRPTALWTDRLQGEAREQAVEMVRSSSPGGFLVAAGETTVTITGPAGAGGRNQEAALAAALAIAASPAAFAALGTDGIDGPTPAAGALVDGDTADRIRAVGLDPRRALERHDSYTALSAAGDLVVTGPTGTNVGDLWIGYRPEPGR